MKISILNTIGPVASATTDAGTSPAIDSQCREAIELLKSGNTSGAKAIIDNIHDAKGIQLARKQLLEMWINTCDEDYDTATVNGIDTLHTLVAAKQRNNVDFLSLAATTIYIFAFIHYKNGENKKAGKELEKAQKLYERLAKKDSDRFTPALMAAVEASTEIFKSKLKKMNILAHYQVATELNEGKVSAGTTEAIDSLVDSITAEGDIHLKMGNYRDAVRFYTKALRYRKRISMSTGPKELRISINLGNALIHLSNRREAGEQLLRSLLPAANKLEATAEIEEINKLLESSDQTTFDIISFWKKLFSKSS